MNSVNWQLHARERSTSTPSAVNHWIFTFFFCHETFLVHVQMCLCSELFVSHKQLSRSAPRCILGNKTDLSAMQFKTTQKKQKKMNGTITSYHICTKYPPYVFHIILPPLHAETATLQSLPLCDRDLFIYFYI